jgi:hypothetical protein
MADVLHFSKSLFDSKIRKRIIKAHELTMMEPVTQDSSELTSLTIA